MKIGVNALPSHLLLTFPIITTPFAPRSLSLSHLISAVPFPEQLKERCYQQSLTLLQLPFLLFPPSPTSSLLIS